MKKSKMFENKLIINGAIVKDAVKKVTAKIADKELSLNCSLLANESLKDAYQNSFKVPAADKNIEVMYAKSEKNISACLYVDEKIEFAGMSMQSIFIIVETLFGIKRTKIDRLYIKSNTNRKQATKEKQAAQEPQPTTGTVKEPASMEKALGKKITNSGEAPIKYNKSVKAAI